MARMTIEELSGAVAAALGPRLVAFLLYGSAARRGAHVAGRSDVNTLLICDTVDDALFAALAPALSRWRRTAQPPPLIFTQAEWRESADAFPVEYGDMREAHRLLAGRDPWPGVSVEPDDLRRQLEHELKGKIIRLRQACAALRERPRDLADALAASVSGLLAMLRGVLRLAGRAVPAPPEDQVAAVAVLVGFPEEAIAAVVAHAHGRASLRLTPGDPRATAYLAAVTRTADFVNQQAGRKGTGT